MYLLYDLYIMFRLMGRLRCPLLQCCWDTVRSAVWAVKVDMTPSAAWVKEPSSASSSLLNPSWFLETPSEKRYSRKICFIINCYVIIFNDFFYSAVKWLIAINRIQNKSFCLHSICVCTVYIYYVYINTHTHTCMYIFKKNMLHLYIKYIYK